MHHPLSQKQALVAYEVSLLGWLRAKRDHPYMTELEPSSEAIKDRWFAEQVRKKIINEFNRSDGTK